MKKFLLCTVAAVVFISMTLTVFAMELSAGADLKDTTLSEANIPSETSLPVEEVIELEPSVVERVETTDREILNQKITECENRMAGAENMREAAEFLDYEAKHPVITLAEKEWNNAKSDYDYYNEIIAELDKKAEEEKWNKKQQEYPTATTIWRYMKDLGWSDYVCAGIMGNLMTEVGGQTLDIQHTLYNPSGYYYGICQWNRGAYGEIHGAGLGAQLDFLRDTIEYEMDTYGMKYETFLSLTNEREVALAFAKGYERCGSGSYGIRQSNAEKAYDYFVD